MTSEKRSLSIVSLIQIPLVLALLSACRFVTGVLPSPTATLPPTSSRVIASTVTIPVQTIQPSRSATQASTPSMTASAVPSATPASVPYQVYVHPEGALYVGDQVSFEVIGQPEDESQATITIAAPEPITLGPAKFESFGIARRSQATFLWAWDTSGLPAGVYTATVSVHSALNVNEWQISLSLLPADERNEGHWATISTDCCVIHYITGTASERDIDSLIAEANAQARHASQIMDVRFSEPLTVTLLSRVLGHGGFANDESSISYLDRNYANDTYEIVLHHEMIHILDASLGGDYRPSLFVEGLAVYMTGGHFKPEPLMERAAALLQIEGGEWYIPFEDMSNDFYASQHEISYLEAGALIDYMVDRWGWAAFSDFYRTMKPSDDKLPATAINNALQEKFNLSLAELEADFLNRLKRQTVRPEQREDLRLTVIYYDTLRHYQQVLDPSAYFATAWLMDGPEMRRRGIVADYVRHPSADENLALETLLLTANIHLAKSEFLLAEEALNDVETVLQAIEAGSTAPFATAPLAADYLEIVQLLRAEGYEAQKIYISNEQAEAQVTVESPELIDVQLQRTESSWEIVSVGEPVPFLLDGCIQYAASDDGRGFLLVPFN